MNMINVLNLQTFIIVGGSLYVVFAICERIVILSYCHIVVLSYCRIVIVVHAIYHVNVETMIVL